MRCCRAATLPLHGAERPDRRSFHHDGDHTEYGVRRIVDDIPQLVAAFTQCHQGKAEQNRKQQHLQNVALGKGADHAVRDDVENEVDRFVRLGLLDVFRHRRRIRMRRKSMNGTPSYVIGKQVVIGAVGLDTLKEKIGVARCGKATC